jgi:adenosylcobyric acid synthase
MVHGLFEDDGVRHAVLDQLRARRGLVRSGQAARWDRDAEYDRLAEHIAQHCDRAMLHGLVGIG